MNPHNMIILCFSLSSQKTKVKSPYLPLSL